MSSLPARVLCPDSDLERMIALVVNSVRSAHSRRAYERALILFLLWSAARGRPPFCKALVQEYRTELERGGLAPASVNQRLCAIRKLAVEAADNGLLAPELAAGIARVKGVRMAGVRSGMWLTREQAQELLSVPDRTSNKGRRDLVILALLLGCGLRRQELAGLTIEHVQEREGRWVIADLVGKGGRIRSIVMPRWARAVLDEWLAGSGITSGPILRRVNKSDVISSAPLTAQGICSVVKSHGERMGLRLAPHDLRRTFAKLARRGGADLAQVQLSLGHASMITTERYLGARLDFTDAPADHLGLTVPTADAWEPREASPRA